MSGHTGDASLASLGRSGWPEWLTEQRHRDNPVGDLARDVDADAGAACLDRNASPDALREHIVFVHHGHYPEVLDALARADAEWKAATS